MAAGSSKKSKASSSTEALERLVGFYQQKWSQRFQALERKVGILEEKLRAKETVVKIGKLRKIISKR